MNGDGSWGEFNREKSECLHVVGGGDDDLVDDVRQNVLKVN